MDSQPEEFRLISGRKVPLIDIMNYVNFLRGSNILANRFGVQGYDDERSRLHNKIFLSAGFKDTRWGTARRTASWFETMSRISAAKDPDIGYDQELVDFKRALDDELSEYF